MIFAAISLWRNEMSSKEVEVRSGRIVLSEPDRDPTAIKIFYLNSTWTHALSRWCVWARPSLPGPVGSDSGIPKESEHLSSATLRLAGPGPGAVLAGGLFAVSRLNWQWSVVAEVFALNNFFIGILLFLTTSFRCAENATQRVKVTQHAPSLICYSFFFLWSFIFS